MLSQKYILAKKQSLRRLFLYTGPALIVSMAYMDPGNYGTDIAGGASLNYSLLWVVWLSSAMAMMLQYLSGKLGITAGKSLPEIIREKLKKENIHHAILASCRSSSCCYRPSGVSWGGLGAFLAYKEQN